MAIEETIDDLAAQIQAEFSAKDPDNEAGQSPVDSPLDDDLDSLFGEEKEPELPLTPPKTPVAGLALPPTPKAPVSSLALPSVAKTPATPAPEPSHARTKAPFSGLALPPRPKVSTTSNPGQSLAIPANSNGPTIQAPPVDVQKPTQPPAKRKRSDDEQEKAAKKQKKAAVKANDQPATFATPPWVKQAPGQSLAKRKRTDNEQEPPAKKQKSSPNRFYYCRYGCPRPVRSRANLKAHMEKVHNLWLKGEWNFQCSFCSKMFRDKDPYEKHCEAFTCIKFDPKEDWKVPPPQTLQEYADTWGMAIHGDISSYLHIPVDDQGNAMDVQLSPELIVQHCEAANIQEVPNIEIPRRKPTFPLAVPAQRAPPVAVARPVAIPQQASTQPLRSYDEVMRDLNVIASSPWIPRLPNDLLEWAEFQAWINPTGGTLGNPILLD